MGNPRAGSTFQYDAEESLGFDVLVAELELFLGNKQDHRIDEVQLLELLQKLLPSIPKADKAQIKQFQKRCDAALIDGCLLKGVCREVRQLVYACLGKLYTLGDMLPMYSRVNSLQAFMNSKDFAAKTMIENVRVGVIDCVAYLALHQGRYLASGATDSMTIAAKIVPKSAFSIGVRCAALRLVCAVIEGVGAQDRSALSIQTEAYKLCDKHVKKESSFLKDETPDEVRLCAWEVLASICRAGAVALWANGGALLEEAIKAGMLGLEDPCYAVQQACAAALGELAASPRHPTAAAALAAEKQPRKKAALERLLSSTMKSCLVLPFCEAAVYNKKEVCQALAMAWSAYSSILQQRYELDEDGLVDVAVQAVGLLEACSRSYTEAREKGFLSPDMELGSCLSGGELPMAQACIMYLLRVGVVEQLGEAGQRKLLERLTLVTANSQSVPAVVVALEGVGFLLELLGEVTDESATSLESAITSKVTASCMAVRSQAASALCALALSVPHTAAKLFGNCLECLEAAALQLAHATAPSGRNAALPSSPHVLIGTPRASSVPKDKQLMDAVSGFALAASALSVACVRLSLGVPSRLPLTAYTVAKRLISQPYAGTSAGRSVEREAGFTLLGSLVVSMHPDSLLERQSEILQLFAVAFGPTARQQLDDKNFAKPGGEVELAVQLWWRSVALESLQAYVVGVIGKGLAQDTAAQVRQISEMLSPLLQAVQKQASLQDPMRARGGPGGWPAAAAAMLQLRLLEVYFYLPGAHTYSMDHASIIKLCIKLFRGSPPGATLSTEYAAAVGRSSLRSMLNSQDAVLGPWMPGRDLLEDELRMFSGDRGGPQQHPWEAGMSFTSGFLSSEQPGGGGGIRIQRRFMPFSQPQALGHALLEIQLWLLGKMMAVISPSNQFQVLEVVNIAVQPRGGNRKDKELGAKRLALCRCAAVATLAGLSPMIKRAQRNAQEGGERLAEKLMQVAHNIIDENLSDAALCRVGSEIIAAAACVGGDALAVKLVKSLCKNIKDSIAENRDVDRRPVWSLALGSIHRSKGGMALQSVSSLTSDALVLCASRPISNVHLWALHGLWLLANAAGLAYMPHVRNTLQLAQELLVSPFGELPKLKPFVARLANAMVAVLGPEFTLGSAHYRQCKSLVVGCELADAPSDGQTEAVRRTGGVDTTLAELETVLFVQQLILFSPKAVPAYKHIALLEATLPSPRPSLRKAAAATLRHLAERDPHSVLEERIELSLFAALDAEADPATSSQLKATLRTLLAAGALKEPLYWIRLLGDVAMSNTAAMRAGAQAAMSGAATSVPDVGDRDDDDDDGYSSAPRATPAPASSQSTDGTTPSRIPTRTMTTTPRLRTRLFAADCLLSIFRVVQEDARHSDVSMIQAARGESQAGKGDWLVQHLQGLTDLGFRLSTGQTEALKPLGVHLLESTIRTFGSLPDPVIEEALLLEQYQAQFVSALRAALAGFNVPTLAIAGGTLATTFLDSGLAGGDATVMKRLMELLTTPLANWDALQFEAYAEWVGVRTKVALLQAHARCACIAKQHSKGGEEDLTASIVEKAHRAHRDMLLAMWTALVVDYAILATQPNLVHSQYKSSLYGESSPAVVSAIQQHYAAACPVVLEALTASLEHADALVAARTAAHLGDDWNLSALGTPLPATSQDADSLQPPSRSSATAADAVERRKQQTWQSYCMLLDVTIMLMCETAMTLAATIPQVMSEGDDAGPDVDRLVSVLKAASLLLDQEYLNMELCPPSVALDLIRTLTTITYQVAYPLQWHMYKRGTAKLTPHVHCITSAISALLKQLVLNMPPTFLPTSTNIPLAITECILSCTSIICPFARLDKAASGYVLTGGTAYVPLALANVGVMEGQEGSGVGMGRAPGQTRMGSAVSNQLEQSLVGLLVAGQTLLKKLPLADTVAPATHLLEMGTRLLATLPVGVQLSAAQRFFEGCMSLVTERLGGAPRDGPEGDVRAALTEAAARAVLGVMDGAQSGLQNYLTAGHPDPSPHSAAATAPAPLTRAEQARTRICTQLAAALGGAALLPQPTAGAAKLPHTVAPMCACVQKHCKAVLNQAVQPQQPLALRCKVVSVVRQLVQEGIAAGAAKQQWALEVAAAAAPQLSLLVHSYMQQQGDGPLDGDALETVTESLKCLVLAVTGLASKGEAAQVSLLRVLVPLLVEAATPPGSGGSPSLKDMSIKLVMHMPHGAAAGAFRMVLANLPASAKQRLQAAIRDAAATSAPTPQPSGPSTPAPVISPAKPTITLRTTFALPLPS